MLKGQEFGAAIDAAIKLKLKSGAVASKAAIARHFGMQPPSLVDWVKKGSVSKEKLPALWAYFADVVGPDHWGLSRAEWPAGLSKNQGSSLLRATEASPPYAPRPDWPFPLIPEAELRALPIADIARIEGAMALAIAQLRLGLEVTPASLASAFDLSPLKSEQAGDVLPVGSPANDDYIEIPQFETRMSAGSGALALEAHPRNKLAFRKSFLRAERVKPSNGAVVYADGHSMAPVIPHRAALLLDLGARSLEDGSNGKVFGFRLEDELRIKRLVMQDDGTIHAHSYNPEFEMFKLDGSVDFEIIGRAVWMGTRL